MSPQCYICIHVSVFLLSLCISGSVCTRICQSLYFCQCLYQYFSSIVFLLVFVLVFVKHCISASICTSICLALYFCQCLYQYLSSIVFFLLVFVLVFVWQREGPGAGRSILIIHPACKSHSRDVKSLPDSGQVDDDVSIVFL